MAYVAAAFLVEVPWVLVQALVYMATFYTTCGYVVLSRACGVLDFGPAKR